MPDPDVIVDRDLARQTFGTPEREYEAPPLTPDLAAMLACLRDARDRLDRMQQRLDRAMQAKQQQDGKL